MNQLFLEKHPYFIPLLLDYPIFLHAMLWGGFFLLVYFLTKMVLDLVFGAK